jgi:predicted acetyltransferase
VPEQTLCGFDGKRMIASAGAFDFKMRFNGRAVSVDGVTVVATDPGYRRRGIVRQLITGLLHRSRDNNVPISILWASMGAIYQRFGYGLATTDVSYDIPPRCVQFQYGERAPGSVKLLEKDAALPALQAIYRQFSGPANGMLHRGPIFWDLMFRRQHNQNVYAAVYFDEANKPKGYCLYRTREQDDNAPEPSQVIDVHDFSWLDIQAYRGIWEYLAGHDLANRIRLTFVPEDDPAPGMLLEPRMLQRKTTDGVWLRVVDVEQALSARGYDCSGEAILAVIDDEICDWNNGRYRIATTGGATEVTRLADGDDADVVTRPDTLASLLSGHTKVSDLARMGRLTIANQARAVALDHLFSTRRRPSCANMF